jgi:hypothetical protein
MPYLLKHADGDFSARLENPNNVLWPYRIHVSAIGMDLLEHINRLQPITTKELLEKLGVQSPTVARARYRTLQQLRKQFLISKRKHGDICLTKIARAFIELVQQRAAK